MASSRGGGFFRLTAAFVRVDFFFPADDKKVRLIGRLPSFREVLGESSRVDALSACLCAHVTRALLCFGARFPSRPSLCAATALCVLVAARLIANCQA